MKSAIALVAAIVATSHAHRVLAGPANASDAQAIPPAIESARVEEALRMEDDGYKSAAYIVMRKGQRVAVQDPLAQTSYVTGDEIKYTVARWQSKTGDGLRTINFIVLPPMPKLS